MAMPVEIGQRICCSFVWHIDVKRVDFKLSNMWINYNCALG